MKKTIPFVILVFTAFASSAQSNALALAEDSLMATHRQLLSEENDSIKLLLNNKFSAFLFHVLSESDSYNYPFDSIKSMAILSPEDKSFRIFNWELGFTDGSIAYFGMIQVYNFKKKNVQLILLNDQAAQLKKPENQVLDANNWYGAHYYKLISTIYKKKTYYSLLGANWSNTLLRHKLIDVVQLGKDGKLKFGQALFQNKAILTRRVVFSYSSEVSMSLRYDEAKKMILFDHLVPRSPELKGQYEFYGPDMSVDGYTFKKGKWQYVEDIDARNEKRN